MLFGGTVPHESYCDWRTWRTHIKSVRLSQHFFQIDKSEEQSWSMLVTHIMLISNRDKNKKNAAGLSMRKRFAIFLWRTYTGKKKTKQKTFHWFSHFKHVFVSYTSCLLQSIFKNSLTISWNFFETEYQEKQDFVILFVDTYCWIWNDLNFAVMFGSEIKTSHIDDPKYFKVWPLPHFEIRAWNVGKVGGRSLFRNNPIS